MNNNNNNMITFLQTSGFVFPGSEIYGGLSNTWDYGPLGVALQRNIKNLWWKNFINLEKDNLGLNSSILMNNKVWKSSGHIDNFNDPLIDCKKCRSRFRADKMLHEIDDTINWENFNNEELTLKIKELKIKCPKCKEMDFTDVRNFHLMFSTQLGILENNKSTIYLRPETAQGIFINFKNVYRSMRKKLPFGVGQIGKVFRNEITPGNFIFRTREFEQMELELFCLPTEVNHWYDYYIKKSYEFLVNNLNINKSNLRIRKHSQDELAHYSTKTSDIEYKFDFGWGELWGIAHRGNFDLEQHQKNSDSDLYYFDQLTNTKILPDIIEPSVGVDRLILTVLNDAYNVETVGDSNERIVMNFAYDLAPYKVAVLPLSKKNSKGAQQIFNNLLLDGIIATYDETASIGKRYRRQDGIGTPWVITFDFDSETDNSVTIRHRDTMKQTRIKITDIKKYLNSNKFNSYE